MVIFLYKNKEVVRNTLAFLLLCAVHIDAFSYEGPIVADRPGFSTSTYTVTPGKFVVELGYQFAFNNNGIDQSTVSRAIKKTESGNA